MPRSIADISKELKAKQDSAAKNDAAIAKRTEDKKKQAGIIADLRPKISQLETTLGTINKSLKDSKTKKEHRPGLEAQKKTVGNQLAEHQTKMDAALEEHDVCVKLLETLSKGDQPIEASITKLKTELQIAQDGQMAYGETRKEFKSWYTGQIAKIKVMADVIKAGQDNVARLLAETDAAAEKNDLDAARSHAKQAKAAAEKNQAELDKLEAHQRKLDPEKLQARNLKPSAFSLLPADVQVHAALNKAALDLFVEEDRIAAKARARVKESEEDAEEATHRAAEGAKTAQNMAASLARSLAALQTIDAAIKGFLASFWGKTLTDGGARYTQATTRLKAKPVEELAHALKEYEQSNVYLSEAYTRLQRLHLQIQVGAKKAMDAVPAGLRDELAAEMAPIKKLAADTNTLIMGYAPKTAKALAELDKLKTAIDALA